MKGFCDLNISIPSSQFNLNWVKQLISLGYKTVALNTIVRQEPNETPGKKKARSKESVPSPQTFNIETEYSRQLEVLQRVTVYFSDSDQLQKLCKSDHAKKYDIISVIPSSFNAFQLACACKDIDMISFDASEQPPIMNRKSYNLAISNGLFFEVPYSPAIGDSGQRKNTIQVAHAYHSYGKSKNIVITSGATSISKIRGPYDIVNLGLLFGLSEEQAKSSMLRTSRALICRAEGRRYGRTAITMVVSDLNLESDENSDEEPEAKRPKTVDTLMNIP